MDGLHTSISHICGESGTSAQENILGRCVGDAGRRVDIPRAVHTLRWLRHVEIAEN